MAIAAAIFKADKHWYQCKSINLTYMYHLLCISSSYWQPKVWKNCFQCLGCIFSLPVCALSSPAQI